MKQLSEIINYIKGDEEIYIATWNYAGKGQISEILYTGTVDNLPYKLYRIYSSMRVLFISKQRDRLAIVLDDTYSV